MNLQPLFSELIVTQTALDGHASDVWLVRCTAGEYVVRSSSVDETVDAPFLWVCRDLFGIDLQQTFHLERTNRVLAAISPMAVPEVLYKAVLEERQFVVVRKMEGWKPGSFREKPLEMMEDFGRSIAAIHSYTFAALGAPCGGDRYPLEQFPRLVGDAFQTLASRYYKDHRMIMTELDRYCSLAQKMPAPEFSSHIMLDMDPRQFLTDGKRISSMVDTEAYAIGPREMDLVAIECSLDAPGAEAFRRGYDSVLPFPRLQPFREVYRFLFCLMEIKGPRFEFKDWVSAPVYFN